MINLVAVVIAIYVLRLSMYTALLKEPTGPIRLLRVSQ